MINAWKAEWERSARRSEMKDGWHEKAYWISGVVRARVGGSVAGWGGYTAKLIDPEGRETQRRESAFETACEARAWCETQLAAEGR